MLIPCRAAPPPPVLPPQASGAPVGMPRAASWPDLPTMAAAPMPHGYDIVAASQPTTATCRRPANFGIMPNDAGQATVGEKAPAVCTASGHPQLVPVLTAGACTHSPGRAHSPGCAHSPGHSLEAAGLGADGGPSPQRGQVGGTGSGMGENSGGTANPLVQLLEDGPGPNGGCTSCAPDIPCESAISSAYVEIHSCTLRIGFRIFDGIQALEVYL